MTCGRFLRDNGLSLFFGTIFVLALVGQAVAGLARFNDDQVADGADAGLVAGRT